MVEINLKSGCSVNYIANDNMVNSFLFFSVRFFVNTGVIPTRFLTQKEELGAIGMIEAVVIFFTLISHNFTLIIINVYLPSNNNCLPNMSFRKIFLGLI